MKNIGMNDAQAKKDSGGFSSTVKATLEGEVNMVGDGAGPEVGNNYDADPMGETKSNLTYKGGK